MSPTAKSASRLPTVVARHGIHLLGTVLWFDAHRRQDLCFVSTARLGRAAQHKKILCTEETARLLRIGARGPVRALAGPYWQTVDLGRLRLEMLPSGHILGGAQLFVELGDVRILYAGTVCTERLPTALPLQTRAADLLVVEARCVPPEVAGTSHAEAVDALLAFVDDVLSAGATPVVLAEPLGTGQDVLRLLGTAGHRLRAHLSLYKNALAYRESDVRFPGIQRFEGRVGEREVLVYPSQGGATAALARLPRTRIALVSYVGQGRTGGPEAPPVERVIPLGNLSRVEALLGWIEAVAPERTVLFGPYDKLIAQALAARGREALALSQFGQLPLFPG